MGSMPLDLLRSTHVGTAFWAAKLAFLLLGLASTVFLVRLAVPLSRDLVLSTLPRLRATVGGYLVPPYIFVVVNFMILVILKLSDARNHNYRMESPEAASAAAAAVIPRKPLKDKTPPREISSNAWADAAPLASGDTAEGGASAPASSPKIGDSSPGGWSEESCMTTGFDGDSAASLPASAAESGVEAELPSAADVDDHDSMEATWNAIMGGEPARRQLKKNETWSAPPHVRLEPALLQRQVRKSATFRESAAAAAAPTRRVAVGRRTNGRELPVAAAADHNEMDRQFEAFIKKVNDQLRLQREESAAQRQMEMVNSYGH